MKKFSFVSFVCFLILYNMLLPIYATVNVQNNILQSYEISEIDYISQLQSLSQKDLIELGYDNNQIDQIYSYDYVALFKQRAKLDNKTLQNYGYTEKQIIKMKQLANCDDLSISQIKLVATTPKVTMTLYNPVSVNQSHCSINYLFSWNVAPYIYSSEIIAIGWKAININNTELSIPIITGSSNLTLNYLGVNTGNYYTWIRSYDISDIYHSATRTFSMRLVRTDDVYWAKYGNGTISLQASGVGNVYEYYIKIGYGRNITSGSASVTVSWGSTGISFNFVTSTIKQYETYKRIRYDGSIIAWG